MLSVLENTVPSMGTNIEVAYCEISTCTSTYFANMLPLYWYDYTFHHYVVEGLRNMVLFSNILRTPSSF